MGTLGPNPPTAEVWDPDDGTFSPAGSLADDMRFAHTATLLPDGWVLIVGGWGADGLVTAAYVWDPATASFDPAGSPAEGRGGWPGPHTATLLPDRRVLVVGGFDIEGSPLASAEAWDPLTSSFGPAGSLARARADHSATLLPDGRVLIVGGRGVGDEAYATVEIWVPAGHARSATAGPDPGGQRVEMPETRIAITFPRDWYVRTASEDPEFGFMVIWGPDRFGPDVTMESILAAAPPGQAPDPFSPDACTLTSFRPVALTPNEFLDELFGQAPDTTVETLHETLSRVRHRIEPSQRPQVHYAIAGDDAVAYLWCWAVEPPEDDWLSIAETVEFLPAGG